MSSTIFKVFDLRNPHLHFLVLCIIALYYVIIHYFYYSINIIQTLFNKRCPAFLFIHDKSPVESVHLTGLIKNSTISDRSFKQSC